MKKKIQAILQRLLGFDRYLVVFSLFKIATLRWEPGHKEGDINYFLELIEPGDLVLDIGANIGIMAVPMAKRSAPGQVIAFEPVPENFRALQRVVSISKVDNVRCEQLALGAEKGTVQMAMPVIEGVRMQGLTHIDHNSIEGYDAPAGAYEVQQVALDDWEKLPQERIAAIKMDVENYEQFVLAGARKRIARDRPLIYCELWDNENRRKSFEILAELGYQPYVLDKGDLVPFQKGIHSQHNFFFLSNL